MSEKPMTELLRKSGIIPKHIAEFEKWRLIDPVNDEKSAEKMVENLVEEIAQLLDEEPVMRQTMVSPIYTMHPPQRWCSNRGVEFYAVKDEMGRLLTAAGMDVIRGDVIAGPDLSERFTVMEVEPLYEGDRATARLITIEQN